MSYATIKAQIKSIIESQITTAKVVYDYEEAKPTGYPAIMISAYDGNAEFLDTVRNRRSYIFRINCLMERVEVGASEAERILTAMVDQLISTFEDETYYNLNNTCVFARPIPSKWGYVNAPEVDVRSAEILLEAITAN